MVNTVPGITLGEHIAQLREARGLTQEALAAQTGTSRAYIAQVESNHRKPGTYLTWRIARALDVPTDDLLTPVFAAGSAA